MKKLEEYYFFDGKYSKVSYDEVRNLKFIQKVKTGKRIVSLRFSDDLKKRERKEVTEFVETACKRKKEMKEVIIDLFMIFDVKVASKKCGEEKWILFIRTP